MTIISSWGGPDSNSYISISQANSFIKTAIFDDSAWDGLSATQKGAALIQASRDIDTRQYIGTRYFFEQRLEFPRQLRSSFPFNRTSTATLTQDTIQKRMQSDVEEACAHQALKVARDGGRNIHIENVKNNITGISEAIGPIREFVQYGSKASIGNMRMSFEALGLLQDWMTGRRIYRA